MRIATTRLIPLRRVNPVHPHRVLVAIEQPNLDGVAVNHPHHVHRIVLGHARQDTCLDVAEQGDGPLVILIAGGMMDMDQWALVAEPLSETYRVIRYDQRGIGESDQPTEGYTVDQFAEDAVNLIRTLDSGPAVLIGNSLGGTVAMAVAFAAPELVRGIVTCATSAGPSGPPTPPESMQHMMRGAQLPVPQAAAAMMDILFATDFIDEHPDMLDEAVEKRSKGAPMIATLGPAPVRPDLRPDRAAQDARHPHARPARRRGPARPPRARPTPRRRRRSRSRSCIPDAGHALVVEQSQAVAEALSAFLGSIG